MIKKLDILVNCEWLLVYFLFTIYCQSTIRQTLLLGIQTAKTQASEHIDLAYQALQDLPYNTDLLKALADKVLNRDHWSTLNWVDNNSITLLKSQAKKSPNFRWGFSYL